jgi:hypothetical protein
LKSHPVFAAKSRLIGDCEPHEWDLPPKPKWMRWRTYNRYVERYDAYEDILNDGIIELMAQLLGAISRERALLGIEISCLTSPRP